MVRDLNSFPNEVAQKKAFHLVWDYRLPVTGNLEHTGCAAVILRLCCGYAAVVVRLCCQYCCQYMLYLSCDILLLFAPIV